MSRKFHGRTGPTFLVAALLSLASISARGQTVIDADTIRVERTPYRLWGIDAPESRQTCVGGWQAGSIATEYLVALIGSRQVVCDTRPGERLGRAVALCRADGNDLGAAMVAAGMALAQTGLVGGYVVEEAAAKTKKLGLHGHDCVAPGGWRERNNTNPRVPG